MSTSRRPNLVFGQDDDAPPLGRLVGQRGELRGLGDSLLVDAGDREERHRLAVAERDRPGLVEQEDVDVAGRLHRLPDIAITFAWSSRSIPAIPIAESSPPIVVGMRQTRRATRTVTVTGAPRPGARRSEEGEGQQRRAGDQEDDRHRGEEDREGDLVRGLPAARPLDHRDHPVEKRLARVRGHADDEPVGEDARAAGHGAAVPAALADDRRALARDGALVDRRDALDHLAVGGDELAGLDEDEIALAQLGRGDLPTRPRLRAARGACARQVPPRAPERLGLRPAAPFRHRLGEVREEDREPEPERRRPG